MAGLSSVMAITRPLGEVNLTAMNRCVGVYRVHLSGGGGGGGGYYPFHSTYGGGGSAGHLAEKDLVLVPPVTLNEGSGGGPSYNGQDDGSQGASSSVIDSREQSVIAGGGSGGGRAYGSGRTSPVAGQRMYVRYPYRFLIQVHRGSNPGYLYVEILTGRGGGSTGSGSTGGIIKAFRIG